MSTKKLTPEQAQALEVIKSEIFTDQKPEEINVVLDDLFTHVFLSEEFDASDRFRFLHTFKAFKKLSCLLQTGELPNDLFSIRL